MSIQIFDLNNNARMPIADRISTTDLVGRHAIHVLRFSTSLATLGASSGLHAFNLDFGTVQYVVIDMLCIYLSV